MQEVDHLLIRLIHYFDIYIKWIYVNKGRVYKKGTKWSKMTANDLIITILSLNDLHLPSLALNGHKSLLKSLMRTISDHKQ